MGEYETITTSAGKGIRKDTSNKPIKSKSKMSTGDKAALVGMVTDAMSGFSSGDDTNVGLDPMMEKIMAPIDRGFYGHMNTSKIKRTKIMGGQCASKKR
jgi:hypothetical protein